MSTMWALAFALQAATAPALPISDGRARDAAELFIGVCGLPMLGSASAANVLNADPAHARAMTPDEIERVAPPGPGSTGFIVHGDRGGWMAVVFQPALRSCMVNVRDVDRPAMERALTDAVNGFFRDKLKLKKIEAKPVQQQTAAGIAQDTLGWEIQFPNQHRSRIAIIATIADASVNGRQALLTSIVEH